MKHTYNVIPYELIYSKWLNSDIAVLFFFNDVFVVKRRAKQYPDTLPYFIFGSVLGNLITRFNLGKILFNKQCIGRNSSNICNVFIPNDINGIGIIINAYTESGFSVTYEIAYKFTQESDYIREGVLNLIRR